MSYCEDLLKKFGRKFSQSTMHDLTNDLCTGILPNHKLFTYLVQDLKFFQMGLKLFGIALRLCDDPQSAVILGKQIGFFCSDENSYFYEVLAQLRAEGGETLEDEIPEMYQSEPTLDEVQRYLDTMDYLALKSNDYAEIITFLYVMEKVYLGWAQYNLDKGIPDDLQFKHLQWVKLHSGADFENWVMFLENEVNRMARNITHRSCIEKWFDMTLDLEIAFFDACYDYFE